MVRNQLFPRAMKFLDRSFRLETQEYVLHVHSRSIGRPEQNPFLHREGRQKSLDDTNIIRALNLVLYTLCELLHSRSPFFSHRSRLASVHQRSNSTDKGRLHDLRGRNLHLERPP